MRNVAFFSTLTLLGSLTAPLAAPAALFSRSNQSQSPDAGETLGADLMRNAQSLEAEGKLGAAYDQYRALVQKAPLSTHAPKAQLKMGRLLEQQGNLDKAFGAYDTYLEKYPRGDDFDGVVESMYKIAKLFLEGEKSKKLLGIPVGGSVDRAREMFDSIIKRAPFSKWAPMAQFNIGQANEREAKYPEAIAAYQLVVTRYAGESIAGDAQYQIGYVLLKEHREGSYDRASAQKAREAFEDFISRYPESEKVPQARENMASLEGGSNKSILEIARFYDRTKQFKAAVIYYNEVIQQQPDSPESGLAKARIAELKGKYGEDALRAGPERAQTGTNVATRRKMQARVDTVSRPDYVGPPVKVAEDRAPASGGSKRPKLRTTPESIGPVEPVEPALPSASPAGAEAPLPEASKPADSATPAGQ